jgi:uncharacterized protein YjbI with pentapeptide repeats
MKISSISQFGFAGYVGSPTPPPNAVAGWTCVSAANNNLLASVPNASGSAAQLFNAYFYPLPPNTTGTGMLLQTLANGKYVAAQSVQIGGVTWTGFAATAATQDDAAKFGIYQLNANVALFWQNPADSQWYGLLNIATDIAGGNGIVAASPTRAYTAPFLLPWQAAQTNPNWSFTAPAGWNVGNGSDLSWVDLTCLPSTAFPFDFTRCRLANTNLTGKTFGHAKFVGCDLSTASMTPPLGAAPDAWIDFTGATVNYPSLGPDWRYLNLTKAIINAFPAPPGPPPQINAQGSILDYVNMIQWNLNKADFTGASLCNTNLSGSYLAGVTFHGAKLSPTDPSSNAVPANLAYSYLFDADLSDANLQGVSFAYAFLYGKAATVSGASLREADFSNAFLPEADFSGVYQNDLVGVGFDGACLAGANFQGTVLGKVYTKGFSFVGAALQGADFTGSNLQGANLTNAAIAITAPPPSGNKLSISSQYKLGSNTVSIEPITYARQTVLAPTDATTACPTGNGPCQGSNLSPANPERSPLKSWPVSNV